MITQVFIEVKYWYGILENPVQKSRDVSNIPDFYYSSKPPFQGSGFGIRKICRALSIYKKLYQSLIQSHHKSEAVSQFLQISPNHL